MLKFRMNEFEIRIKKTSQLICIQNDLIQQKDE
jgi:hypothetical protein